MESEKRYIVKWRGKERWVIIGAFRKRNLIGRKEAPPFSAPGTAYLITPVSAHLPGLFLQGCCIVVSCADMELL